MSELLPIIGDWVARTIPHFSVERYQESGWLGWIKCPCELKHGAAIARIEDDRICFMALHDGVYSQAHDEVCSSKERNPVNDNCYCGEKVITLFDADGFKNLEQTVKNTHAKLLRRQQDD